MTRQILDVEPYKLLKLSRLKNHQTDVTRDTKPVTFAARIYSICSFIAGNVIE